MYEYDARQHILAMLKESKLLTSHIRNNLQYNHMINYRNPKVRSLLRQMEKEGLVSVIILNATNKIGWQIVKH